MAISVLLIIGGAIFASFGNFVIRYNYGPNTEN